ncbi:MAG: hypothetical protein HOP10_15715 [Chitinophagaceae bacterium]|nr:hypothetical protein [Chitinophagaceae bacterium]
MDVNPVAIIVIAIVVIIIIRLVAGVFDGGRIEDHFSEEGKEFISKEWAPLGKGWFGDSSDRIYVVRYKDKDGHIHEAYCKTSMFSGVYITEDKIVEYNKDALTDVKKLEAENLKLKEELERLKKGI